MGDGTGPNGLAPAVDELSEAVADGATEPASPAGGVSALRAAIGRLLGDAVILARLGAAARELDRSHATDMLLEAYSAAIG